ncbi:MAG: hypothetical protein J3R72DRAFT_166150 [Linnemannia gamsii]|nr:MAG: hypothetical protein J3R72DRAFT_166150 [Linnemannia gamsii]
MPCVCLFPFSSFFSSFFFIFFLFSPFFLLCFSHTHFFTSATLYPIQFNLHSSFLYLCTVPLCSSTFLVPFNRLFSRLLQQELYDNNQQQQQQQQRLHNNNNSGYTTTTTPPPCSSSIIHPSLLFFFLSSSRLCSPPLPSLSLSPPCSSIAHQTTKHINILPLLLASLSSPSCHFNTLIYSRLPLPCLFSQSPFLHPSPSL